MRLLREDALAMRAVPFDNVKLLDVSQRITGRYASMLIAELGADVVRVDDPSFAHWSGRQRSLFDRSKRSIALHLEDAAGQKTLRRLLHAADVLVTDLPPAEARRIGLDAPSIDHRFPALVHCSILPLIAGDTVESVWTEEGAAALAGLYSGQPTADGDPHLLPVPLSSYAAGLIGATAIAAGLLQRRRTGRRVTIKVPQLAAALLLHLPSLATSTRSHRLPGSGDPLGQQPTYRLYRAADDWFVIACPSRSFFDRLCLAIDRLDLAVDQELDDAPWQIENADVKRRLIATLSETFSAKPRSHWVDVLTAAGVPAAPVQDRYEFMTGPLVAENGLAVTVAGDDGTPLRQMSTPLKFGGSPRQPAPARPPGADTDSVESDPNWRRPSQVKTVTAEPSALPLSGVRVLDVSSYFAGPLCGSVLADLGADVIKIEPPQGEGFRFSGLSFLSINRGKRSLCLDLEREEGRAAFRRLAGTADVLLTSLLPSRSKRLGLDAEALLHENPGLVAYTISGLGDAEPRDRPTFDPLLQALSGSATHLGSRERPHLYSTAISDAGAGLVALLGIVSALYDRADSGRGGVFEANQIAGAMAIQIGEFEFAPGEDAPGGHDASQLGPSATRRLYRATDRWILLEAADRPSWQDLCQRLGWEDLIGSYSEDETADGNLARAISARVEQRSVADLTNAAKGTSACLLPVQRPGEALGGELARAAGLVSEISTPDHGRLRLLGPTIQVPATDTPTRRSAPELGEHSIEILSEAGFTPREVSELLDGQAIRALGSDSSPRGADQGP